MELNGYNVDSTSDPAISQHVSDLGHQTNADVARDYSAGGAAAKGLLTPDNYNTGLSYGDRATHAAIRSRYMQPAVQQEQQLSTEIMSKASGDHIRNLTMATQAAGQEVEMNKQKAMLKYQVEQANRRAKARIYGDVLGIVGGVAGAVGGGVAGGPMGAVAGAGAGQKLGEAGGQMIGGGY